MNAAELIEYIRTAEKKTPVKVYIWERFPTSFPNAKVFPAGDGAKIVFGDWRDIGPAVRAQQDGFGGECVVSFAEHGCTDGERLAFGRLSGKRSVFDDGEHFDDRDTGQQFLAHIPHPNVWTDQLIGEDHTTECDRSPMSGRGRAKIQRREQTAGVASEQLGCHPRLSTCDAESVSAIDSGEECNAEDDVQQDRRDQADDLPG